MELPPISAKRSLGNHMTNQVNLLSPTTMSPLRQSPSQRAFMSPRINLASTMDSPIKGLNLSPSVELLQRNDSV